MRFTYNLQSIIFCIFCVILLNIHNILNAAAIDNIALVIGNSTYKTGHLNNALNDARDISRTLAELNFEVILIEDADRRTIMTTVEKFIIKLKQKATGLFYYAGHGVQVKGENYIIPLDVDIYSQGDVEFEAVNIGWVLTKMEEKDKPKC